MNDRGQKVNAFIYGGTVSNNAIPFEYDEFEITYIESGNGEGEIGTITYKKSGDTVGVVTLTYDSDHRIIHRTLT